MEAVAPEFKPLPEQLMYGPFFDLVKNESNWKYAIDKVLEAPRESSDYDRFVSMIERAVEFYAGGGAKVVKLAKANDKGWPVIRVTAPGYYTLIGA